MKIGVIGFGAFTREIIPRLRKHFDVFVASNYMNKINETAVKDYLAKYSANLYPLESFFDKNKYSALITLTNGAQREEIVNFLPNDTTYYTFIDENAVVYDADNSIGKGSVICAGTIITTNVQIKQFVQLNLGCTVGHDSILESFTTFAPGVNISGRCKIGSYTYFGTNSSLREKIEVGEHIVIGAQSTVVKDILEKGIYAGIPAKKLK